MFNAINIKTEYCIKCRKILLRLRFIQSKDFFFKNYDFRTLDVNTTFILASKYITLHFKGMNELAMKAREMIL